MTYFRYSGFVYLYTYIRHVYMMTMTYSRYSGYVYDAVWLYARVLDALIRKDKSLVQVKSETSPIFCFTFIFSRLGRIIVFVHSNTITKKSPENLFLLKEAVKEGEEISKILLFLLFSQTSNCLFDPCANTKFSHRKWM